MIKRFLNYITPKTETEWRHFDALAVPFILALALLYYLFQ